MPPPKPGGEALFDQVRSILLGASHFFDAGSKLFARGERFGMAENGSAGASPYQPKAGWRFGKGFGIVFATLAVNPKPGRTATTPLPDANKDFDREGDAPAEPSAPRQTIPLWAKTLHNRQEIEMRPILFAPSLQY